MADSNTKLVRLRADTQWQNLSDFATELQQHLGINVSLADAIDYAVKVAREQLSSAGTPDGTGTVEGSN